MSEMAIRHPKRGKAHRPTRWIDTSVGFPWEGRRVTATACGFGDGGTVRAMTEELPVDHVDPADRCGRCWGDAGRARSADQGAAAPEGQHDAEDARGAQG